MGESVAGLVGVQSGHFRVVGVHLQSRQAQITSPLLPTLMQHLPPLLLPSHHTPFIPHVSAYLVESNDAIGAGRRLPGQRVDK